MTAPDNQQMSVVFKQLTLNCLLKYVYLKMQSC